jgi:hypothetical protein
MRLGRVCYSLILLALGVLIPFTGDADATPFTILPNGDLEIDTAFTTQGVFSCALGCSGSGTNSIIFGSGTNTAALTFFGVSATVPVFSGAKTHATLGVINASATDGFTFPTIPANPNQSLVILSLTLLQSSPVPGAGHTTWGFDLGGGGTQLPLQTIFGGGPTFMELPIGPQPPPYHYSSLVYTFDPFPFTIPSNGIVDVGADIGAIPEPTTLLLFGTTMAGLGLVRWRRRRQS